MKYQHKFVSAITVQYNVTDADAPEFIAKLLRLNVASFTVQDDRDGSGGWNINIATSDLAPAVTKALSDEVLL